MVESKHQWKAWLYLAPALILLLIFTVWPIINTISMAFQEGYDYSEIIQNRNINAQIDDFYEKVEKFDLDNPENPNYIPEEEYPGYVDETPYSVGLGNFKAVLGYGEFGTVLKNTLLLCVLTVPLSTMLALLIAVALNSIKPLQRFLQTIFFLPYVTNSIAIGMVFMAMFHAIGIPGNGDVAQATSVGIVNTVIKFFGGKPVNWVDGGSSYAANIAVMTIYIVWNALPFKILVLLGGLQSVNKQYYEAARVDGTPRRRVFTKITVPLLSPMIAYVVITGFIGGFKEYSSIVGVFDKTMGPPNAPGRLNTMVGYIYNALEDVGNAAQGRASAAAILLFLIIFAVTMVNLQVSKKKVHY